MVVSLNFASMLEFTGAPGSDPSTISPDSACPLIPKGNMMKSVIHHMSRNVTKRENGDISMSTVFSRFHQLNQYAACIAGM